jgi:hypothetical protein
VANSLMSAPAEKWSVPRMTRARTDSSAATSAISPGMADHISKLIALRFAGRSMVSVATRPSVSSLKVTPPP